MANHVAPDGQVYVCGACGKRSKDRYGDKAINRGWDESCMMNSVLVYENSIELDSNGRVMRAQSVESMRYI